MHGIVSQVDRLPIVMLSYSMSVRVKYVAVRYLYVVGSIPHPAVGRI